MKRIRKTQATLDLPTLKLEGGLFLPDQLEKAAQGRASAQSEADYGTPKGVKLKDEYSRAFQIACAQWQHFAAQIDVVALAAFGAQFDALDHRFERNDVGGLADADHPHAIGIGACLHGQMIMEALKMVVLGSERIVIRRVVAYQHHLGAAQRMLAVGFRPAAIVAQSHAENALVPAERSAERRKTEVSALEIALLEVLETTPRLVFGVARQVNLAVFPDDLGVLVD